MKILALVLVPLIALAASPDTPKRQLWGKGGAPWGKPGQDVYLFTLKNAKGMEVTITNFGATVVSIKVPDRKGAFADVVLGYDQLAGYQSKEDPYFGAVVGRYGNRIAKGRFSLDGKTYELAINNPPNTLHGGKQGFDKRIWDVERTSSGNTLVLHYLSPDGEEGYPGNLNVTVRYTLTDANELRIHYMATTDKKTVLNLTNHSYFNLAGQGSGDVLKQEVMINADKFTPVDANLIPTGELKPVAGTPFDLRKLMPIGAHIGDKDQQLEYGRGYDHNFVANDPGKMRLVARAMDPASGRTLEVLSDQPGVQFYTGNFLDGTVTGKQGKVYVRRGAFCFETQHFPDSPNHPEFPTTELKPGETFNSSTTFRFSTSK
jgi:aldose 1-epimerase